MILNNLRFFQFLLIFILTAPTLLYGQEVKNEDSYYKWYDQIIESSNSGIFNGIEYVENYRVLNEKHKFFDNPNFNIGSIVYDGQPYFDIALKYDLFEDQLLLTYINLSNAPTMVLDKNKVTSFEINEHLFKNMKLKIDDSSEPLGFLEMLSANDSIVLYKKYKKRIRTKTNEKTRYYEFKEDNAYFLFYNETFYKLKNASSLGSIFTSYKPQLKTLEGQYKSIKKNNPEAYLISVLGDLFNNLGPIHPIEQ